MMIQATISYYEPVQVRVECNDFGPHYGQSFILPMAMHGFDGKQLSIWIDDRDFQSPESARQAAITQLKRVYPGSYAL